MFNQAIVAGDMPLMLTVEDVAHLLNLSPRSVWRMRSSGQLPAPVTLGGSTRWNAETIRRWIAAGCKPGGSEA